MAVASKREIEELILAAAQQGASDLHLAVGHPPILRIDGQLTPLTGKKPLGPEDTQRLSLSMLDEEQSARFSREKEIDFSFSYRNKIRLRVNIYMQKRYVGAALRLIPLKIRTIEELGLPKVMHKFSKPSQGFVLVTGPTGHGKSTTLAAIVDEINRDRSEHIVTIEDPIEYIFTSEKSIIDQREIGFDSLSFRRALRSSFRQDADIIMLGEMRDRETMSTAVTAAETGHLIFTTLHTNSAAQTIDRIIDSFPPDQHDQIRQQLAGALLGIISQRLLPRLGGGLVPAVEVLIANYAVRNLIRENKTHQIDLVIETGTEEGMISLDRSLTSLVRQGYISLQTAQAYSLNPSQLNSLLSGGKK